MAADSLTKGLGASRLPQIKEDLYLIEDWNVFVKVYVVFVDIICFVSWVLLF